jgi:hypothetical protein
MELRENPASSQIMQGITESLARQVPKKRAQLDESRRAAVREHGLLVH